MAFGRVVVSVWRRSRVATASPFAGCSTGTPLGRRAEASGCRNILGTGIGAPLALRHFLTRGGGCVGLPTGRGGVWGNCNNVVGGRNNGGGPETAFPSISAAASAGTPTTSAAAATTAASTPTAAGAHQKPTPKSIGGVGPVTDRCACRFNAEFMEGLIARSNAQAEQAAKDRFSAQRVHFDAEMKKLLKRSVFLTLAGVLVLLIVLLFAGVGLGVWLAYELMKKAYTHFNKEEGEKALLEVLDMVFDYLEDRYPRISYLLGSRKDKTREHTNWLSWFMGNKTSSVSGKQNGEPVGKDETTK